MSKQRSNGLGRSAGFPVKRSPDGRAMLNIACGVRTHRAWNNMDFSPYTRLATRPWAAELLHRVGVLSDTRHERVKQVDPDVVHWDLRNGIPFPDETFDVVYHSHFLEHLERHVAPIVLSECRRVLKPGALLRVVVPDLQALVRRYADAVDALAHSDSNGMVMHEAAMYELFDQMVRTEGDGTAVQRPWVRRIERRFRSAAGTGEAHKWMYDRYSMAALLERVGFRAPTVCDHDTSAFQGWRGFGLDTEPDGTPYKKHSLYMEATR